LATASFISSCVIVVSSIGMAFVFEFTAAQLTIKK